MIAPWITWICIETAESTGRVWKDKWKGLKALYLDPQNPAKGDFSDVAKWRPTSKLNKSATLFGTSEPNAGLIHFDYNEIQQGSIGNCWFISSISVW